MGQNVTKRDLRDRILQAHKVGRWQLRNGPPHLSSHISSLQLPAHYSHTNWPKGLRIDKLNVCVGHNFAVAMINDEMLEPYIPLDQLARFLNDHMQGAMKILTFSDADGLDGQDQVPRLLDEVTVPGRLHVDVLSFTFDFFRLPWAGTERIFDGRTLRAKTIYFGGLQLPSGVDPNKLLELPTVRGCTKLALVLYTHFDCLMGQTPSPPPLFKNASLVEWIKRSGHRSLELTSDYLSSGPLSFLDALKQDFRQATQAHSYEVKIRCPHKDVGAGLVRNEELSNSLGEKMTIKAGEDSAATAMMGHRFETVTVLRLLDEVAMPESSVLDPIDRLVLDMKHLFGGLY